MSKRRRNRRGSGVIERKPQPGLPSPVPPRSSQHPDDDDGTSDRVRDSVEEGDALGPAQVASLVGVIASGGLDPYLSLLTAAIADRRRHVAEAASIRALASVSVGDRVRIGTAIRPRYLQGSTGTVTGWP